MRAPLQPLAPGVLLFHLPAAVGNAAANLGHLYRMGGITAIAIGVHTFPEGRATFKSPSL